MYICIYIYIYFFIVYIYIYIYIHICYHEKMCPPGNEHSVCSESLMTTYIYIHIHTYIDRKIDR